MALVEPNNDPLAETYPPLTVNEALIESNRCLYCYDAPCTHACPTHIDVPKFIKRISTGNLIGSAATILESNLLGATCSRVCPVQELCEGACVLGAEHRPVSIGRLQRHAMDYVASRNLYPVEKGPHNSYKAAVIGAGPAGLSCAGELAKAGCGVTVFEKRVLSGGLSTYGIIALREPVEISLEEVKRIESLGVKIESDKELGTTLNISSLKDDFDAIFLSVGLGATPNMGIAGEEHILDGLAYIEKSKIDREKLSIGHNVCVIGAGNTAIDCATIAARLGAETVTMVYRRSEHEMTAYPHEYEFIKNEGVRFEFLAQPVAVRLNGKVAGLECVRMALGEADASGRPHPLPVEGSNFVIPADQIVKAVGQEKPSLGEVLGLEMERGYIKVDRGYRTSLPNVFAGGDCVRATGAASTVMAVQDGKLAAKSILADLGGNRLSHEVARG